MALPGHSPQPYTGPGSPNRIMRGHVDTQLPPMYGHPTRSMLPPSPQNYRFPNPPPIPAPSPSFPMMNDSRGTVPYKRPGSSMSISSMLGGEPERSAQDVYQSHNSKDHSRQGSVSAPAPAFPPMSPPQPISKPGLGEYSYKPRSVTPDRMGIPFGMTGARQRSSSSGTPLSRPAPFVEHHSRSASTVPAPRYFEPSPNLSFNSTNQGISDQEDRMRRTSLSGILQRPNSQPQISHQTNQQADPFRNSTAVNHIFERQSHPDLLPTDPYNHNSASTTYDIKPPGPHNIGRPNGLQASPTRGPSLPTSPERNRVSMNGAQGRTLASILNGPTSHPPESAGVVAQRMMRQDSSQSQSERSVFGDRGKPRQYSPFAGSLMPQNQVASGTPGDEQRRKDSDELSQHRTLLSLAAESKRGRFSPMPQVMQGAQAQTPVPDAGVKTEHGRVFSGLGGGIGTTPTPVGGPMRKDDNRTPLSEDNLMKMSRSTPGVNKRSRKAQDDDPGAETEMANGSKASNGRANKKGKYQHSYKFDLEEVAGQRRSTPLTGLNPNRNVSVASNPSLGVTVNGYHAQSSRTSDAAPTFKPKKTIKVANVFDNAFKASRRHLGNFTYQPEIAPSSLRHPSSQKFSVSIRPNLLPAFSAAEHVNCTYTVHVPRTWLQQRERGLICNERFLWGSGIYTDDSDPIAAAIHAGFLRASLGDTVDVGLLSRIVDDQNPQIEWPKDLKIPIKPLEVEAGKDLNITLVVLPPLESYESSARFGLKSRAWPEGFEKTQHDGVSFGILKVEFVEIGTEEMRMGRTGAGRRERLRMDLEARRQSLQIQKERIARMKEKKLLREPLPTKTASLARATKLVPTSVPITLTNGTNPSMASKMYEVLRECPA